MPRCGWGVVLFVGAATACQGSGDQSGHLVRIDSFPSGGTRVVSSAPVDAGRWHLVHLLDIQPPPDAPGEVMAPEDLAVGEDGTVVVVEANPVEVRQYDPEGRFEGVLGGTGAGPGEYRQARVALWQDTVFVGDPSQDRLLRFSRAGLALQGSTHIGCCLTYFPLNVDMLGRLVGNLSYSTPLEGGRVAAWFRRVPGSESVDSLWHLLPPPDPASAFVIFEGGRVVGRLPVPFLPRHEWAIDPSGDVLVGSLERYEIRVTRSGLDTVQLFSRPLAPILVTEAERRDFVEATVERDRRFVPEAVLRAAIDLDRIPATKAPIERIWVDRSGRRWVQIASSSGEPIRLDLFDADGRWLDELSVPRDGWPEDAWAPIAFGLDRVAVALEDGSGAPLIRVYRIERR